jgi:ligand-binding SRPBCC domain-containing protein
VFRLKESIHVNAPIERCFLLSTSVDLVRRTLELRPVSGRTAGLIVANDQLVWRGWKFGMPVMHETLITGYSRPTFFQDTQGRGRFHFFQHDHHFHFIDGQTVMWDVVRFSLPFGVLGHAVARRIVIPHVLDLLQKRHLMLKRLAESDDWEQYIPDAADRELARRPSVEDNSELVADELLPNGIQSA